MGLLFLRKIPTVGTGLPRSCKKIFIAGVAVEAMILSDQGKVLPPKNKNYAKESQKLGKTSPRLFDYRRKVLCLARKLPRPRGASARDLVLGSIKARAKFSFFHPEGKIGSQPSENARFFASLRMTYQGNLRNYNSF
jgi:hypothetical protein